jgi:hypothetical protein
MIRSVSGIKPDSVHIRAFVAEGSAISVFITGVIARHSRPKDGVASARL